MLSNERNGEDRTPIRAICSSVVESQLGVYSLLNLRRGRHRCNTRKADAVFEFGMVNKSRGSEVERLVTFLSL